MQILKILCWGHRRAVDPLQAIARAFAIERPDLRLVIDVRPLSDFEHQGMASVAEHYDLIVYDHPFSGDIASGSLFVPLEDRFPDQLGAGADALYMGPSLASYRFAGHVWGAPIDAATQHAAYRADLLAAAGESVPVSWQDVVSMGHRLRRRGLWLGLAVHTPHALLTIGALMSNAGKPWTTDPTQPLQVDREALVDAYEAVRSLLTLCPPEALAWNSIDLHDAMVTRDDIVYTPCVYGYATYAEADQRQRLSFANFAGAVPPHAAGSAIGGTAVGLSSRTPQRASALALIAFLLKQPIQDDLIPSHHGQPAFASAWHRPDNDARFNGYYTAVAESMHTAWIRPRHPGYIPFQNQAGRVVADALRQGQPAREVAIAVQGLADRVTFDRPAPNAGGPA